MAVASIVETRLNVGGVDTHLDVHVAAVVDANGGVLGVESFPTSPAGLEALRVWLCGLGPLTHVGVEGTGAYGAGLARLLVGHGLAVIEVDRANRQSRRRTGKTDGIDAVEAARAALSGRASGTAKTGDGNVEALRALIVAHRSGRQARTRCINQLRQLVVCAPTALREQFRASSINTLSRDAARLRPDPAGDQVMYATKLAMRTLASRVLEIGVATARLDSDIARLVQDTAPSLLALHGVGPHSAALLLIAAGDDPHRLRNEAAFAHLCGVAPIPASSGKTVRLRLNRGGNRRANQALWRITLTRMGSHEPTRRYVERRLAEGRSKPEIMRCLKRYIAREIFQHLPRS
jgi:transposase